MAGLLSFLGVPGLPGAGITAGNIGINSLSGAITGATSSAGLPTTGVASSTASLISNIFLRTVVIILGFIFVAVGLSMFKGTHETIIENVKGKIRAS